MQRKLSDFYENSYFLGSWKFVSIKTEAFRRATRLESAFLGEGHLFFQFSIVASLHESIFERKFLKRRFFEERKNWD